MKDVNIMTEDFVTYELAIKLKDKGYPQKTSGRYSMNDCFYYDGRLFFHGGVCDVNEAYTAPTIPQVLKWLREEKDVNVNISYMPKMIKNTGGISNDFYYPTLQKIGLFEPTVFIGEDAIYDTYEEAAIAGIDYYLNNLI